MEPNALLQLLTFAESSNCLECGERPVVFASVNNGVFLCEKCGELHKQLHEKLSRVKSIHNDTWSNFDIDLMINGGNERIWDAFKFYKMPRDAAFDFKYKTKIGYYYRSMLTKLAKGEDLGTPPNLNEGLTLVNEQEERDANSEAHGNFWDKVNYYGGRGVDYTKKAFKDAKETVTNPEWQRKVKEGTYQAGKKIEKCISEAANDTKKFMLQSREEVKEKGFLTYVKDESKKALSYTRRGLSKIFGYLSKQLAEDQRHEEEKRESPVNSNSPLAMNEDKELLLTNENKTQKLDESGSLLSGERELEIMDKKTKQMEADDGALIQDGTDVKPLICKLSIVDEKLYI